MAVTALRTYIGPRYKMSPVLTAITIGRGAAVSTTAAGYANELVAAEAFAGFAEEDIDSTGLASGATSIRLVASGRVKLLVVGASAVSDVDALVYADTSTTFTLTSTSNSRIGRVSEWITGDYCWVEFKSDADLN